MKIGTQEFDGETYDPKRDHDRLSGQLKAVHDLMIMQYPYKEFTIDELTAHVSWHPDYLSKRPPQPASISARIRDLRKEKFGGNIIERRWDDQAGWVYRYNPEKTVEQKHYGSRQHTSSESETQKKKR